MCNQAVSLLQKTPARTYLPQGFKTTHHPNTILKILSTIDAHYFMSSLVKKCKLYWLGIWIQDTTNKSHVDVQRVYRTQTHARVAYSPPELIRFDDSIASIDFTTIKWIQLMYNKACLQFDWLPFINKTGLLIASWYLKTLIKCVVWSIYHQ